MVIDAVDQFELRRLTATLDRDGVCLVIHPDHKPVSLCVPEEKLKFSDLCELFTLYFVDLNTNKCLFSKKV